MVYGIVKNHQGYIECSSKPAEGTRFNMYFPVLKLGKIPENEVSNNEEKIPTGDETILMVDDEESILDVGKKMLQQFGLSTFSSPELAEGLVASCGSLVLKLDKA
jgi:hypothetical protein